MFVITEHQYSIIMEQAQTAYPEETGGFLGGKAGEILGVLPVSNKNIEGDRKKEFGLIGEDIQRAHDFFKKHGLAYLGVYHSHPKGIAYPSDQDLKNMQKHLFIISLKDRYNPEFRAYTVENRQVIPEDIKIVDDRHTTVIDITTGKPKLSQNVLEAEMIKLSIMIEDIIDRKKRYPKLAPSNKWEASSFNTVA
ncbi:MAG: M67 family metallopeptidase [Candidatus Margulisbacteria bacterium]|nr:M67 family metallopeptidase [Candidatus Margulisiibacteriota bacterium]